MSRERVYKWDNLKLIMIWCVVIGHFLGEMTGGDALGQSIYIFIYTFHMPVFVFLTGLYAKHTIGGKKYEVVVEYLFIYLIMKLLDNLGSCLKNVEDGSAFGLETFKAIGKSILDGKDTFHFFWSDGPEWYALAIAVFLLATMLIKDYNAKYIMITAVFVGCVAGLDNHLGDHFASMRICVFYPVFLAGYYIDPDIFVEKSKHNDGKSKIWDYVKERSGAIVFFIFLIACFLLCFRLNHEFTFLGKTYQDGFLYALRDFFKGKCNYYSIGRISNPTNPGSTISVGVGLWGVLLRLGCYLFWSVMVVAVIKICPNKKYFWTWLGQRTMSTFIWHKFVMVVLLYVFGVKSLLLDNIEHTWLPATICIAIIVAVITAYLPGFRIAKRFEITK